MFKWRVNILLKNGTSLIGIYEGPENGSDAVAKKLLVGPSNDFFGLYGRTMKSNMLVCRGEIAAIDISEYKPKIPAFVEEAEVGI